jgi:urease accessory protein
MLALGLMAAQAGGHGLWALPAAFVAAMAAGAAAGVAGLPFPAVEPMILASVVLLGVAVALAVRLPRGPVLAVVALFGAAHGWAHGAEGPEAALAAYGAGFVLATAGLHLAGIALGRSLGALPLRILGGAAALGGLMLAVA